MATQVTNTLFVPDSSTVACACAAHALDGEHRQQLAVQVLARTEPVTKLAERHGVSRKFVYHQADKGAQALEQAFQSPRPNDEEVLFYLPVTRAWLHQVVLG
jgi:RecA/RadA recombinase